MTSTTRSGLKNGKKPDPRPGGRFEFWILAGGKRTARLFELDARSKALLQPRSRAKPRLDLPHPLAGDSAVRLQRAMSLGHEFASPAEINSPVLYGRVNFKLPSHRQ